MSMAQNIDISLAKRLVSSQFPKWSNLPIYAVEHSGWDNCTFHLGDEMTIRLPIAESYASQVEKEQFWLPQLAEHLQVPISQPLVMGKPEFGYPWNWSIYKWLPGETATVENTRSLELFALDLAGFLTTFQSVDTTGGPEPGQENFYRGGSLATYDAQLHEAIAIVRDRFNEQHVTDIWRVAVDSAWQRAPVWVHGDIAVGNLLVTEGRLSAVIDFGQLAIGDPACDYAIAWTFFSDQSRIAFRSAIATDHETWTRGIGWALWKALIIQAGLVSSTANQKEAANWTINEILKA